MKWISVQERLPPVKWSAPNEEGKSYFDSIPVLILRETILPNGEKIKSVAVGEYDTQVIPERWFIGYYTLCDKNILEFESIDIDDVTHWMPLPGLQADREEMNLREYIPYCPFGPFSWVIIEYDGHHGFACDWQDCLEEIIFIDGYSITENYIDYDDPKLTYFEPMMCKNR